MTEEHSDKKDAENTGPEIVEDVPEVVYTPEQDRIVQGIYRHIAQLLPMVGRDYNVSISFEGNDAHVTMKSITESGTVWINFLRKYFGG